MNTAALRGWLAAEIAAHGPMPVERYMRECLMHEQFGYYRTQQAIGAMGDFITAPEISQVFGELIGIWAAAAWAGLGQPQRWRLVELGPGRGTLMADALRALGVLPAARAGLEVVLVESNEVLVAEQRAKLAGCGVPVMWIAAPGSLAGLPPQPTVLIANEFLDALPIRQFVFTSGDWHERCVGLARPLAAGLDEEVAETAILRFAARLELGAGDREPPATPAQQSTAIAPPPPDGAICEVMAGAVALIEDLAKSAPAYLLFIDYGHEGPVFGDTLQAVTAHHFADPLAEPGNADLSAQVDFAQVGDAAIAAGFVAFGLITQAEFLGRLGAAERLERLCRGKPAATVQALQSGLGRLMQPAGMGGRFKALALASKGLAAPPAF